MTLGNKLAKYRKLYGLTQQQLGERLNLSAQAISKWENDLAQPDLLSLKALSQLYRVSLDEMLDLDGEVGVIDGAREVGEASHSDAGHTESIFGFCKNCGVAVKDTEVGMKEPSVLCKSCAELLKKKLSDANKELEKREMFKQQYKRYRLEEALKRAFISGGISGGIILLIALFAPIGAFKLLFVFFAYSIFALRFLSDFDSCAMDAASVVMSLGVNVEIFGIELCADELGIIGFPLRIVAFLLRIAGFLVFIPLGLVLSAIVFPFSVGRIVNRVKSNDYSVLTEKLQSDIEREINSLK